MNEKETLEFVGKAFISCSLREEDMPFIEFVEQILVLHKIKPEGTVGRHSAAPLNIAEHMRENIPKSDFVVIVATPRYLQKDLQSGKESFGLSEMVHVEAGMAYMADKPVIVFVQEGTQVGNFLPNITEYVILSPEEKDLDLKKKNLITSLITGAYELAIKNKGKSTLGFGKIATYALAFIGGFTMLNSLFSDEDDKS